MGTDVLPQGSTIGIVGGGQLGRMTAMAAAQLGYHAHIFTPEPDAPAIEVSAAATVAAYEDEAALARFAGSVNAITVEFENIPPASAAYLAARTPFYPSPELFAICRNRLKEKAFSRECGAQTAAYASASTMDDFRHAIEQVGLPCIAKHTECGYDGKGQARIVHADDMLPAWEVLGAGAQELIIEAFVPFVAEASVIIARDRHGAEVCFPIARNTHEGGILVRSEVPCGLSDDTQEAMRQAARSIARAGGLIGLLAVEFFVLDDGRVLVNEMAPRPHNSGHWSMDGCNVSQFSQLVRICAGLPLVSPEIIHPTVMHNLIGEEALSLGHWLSDPNARLHLYGKHHCKPGRKMGHVNVCG